MKVIISSEVLYKTLERMSNIEVLSYRLVNGGIEFIYCRDSMDDDIYWMGCETEFYRANKIVYDVKFPFIKRQWENLKSVLKYFPEQPIVMECGEDDIEVTQCILRFT